MYVRIIDSGNELRRKKPRTSRNTIFGFSTDVNASLAVMHYNFISHDCIGDYLLTSLLAMILCHWHTKLLQKLKEFVSLSNLHDFNLFARDF